MEIIVFIKITFTSNQVTTISISVDLYVANHTDSWMVYVPLSPSTVPHFVGVDGGQAQALVPELPRLAGG